MYEPVFGRREKAMTIGAAVLLLVVICTGYFWATQINVHYTQPLRRQNLNHDADWQRAQTANVINIYNDYQAAVQAVPVDKANIARYIQDNGDPKTYAPYSSQSQFFNNLELKLNGDEQAAIRLANSYNAIATNPDQRPDPWPSCDGGVTACPDSLLVPTFTN